MVITACCCSVFLVAAKGVSAHRPSRHDMAQLASGLRPVLREYPDRPLLCVGRERLNGLEFYLGRQIPVPALPQADEAGDTDPQHPARIAPGTLLLLPAKYMRYAGVLFPADVMRTEFSNEFWALTVVEKPLDLWSLAQQAGLGGRTAHRETQGAD